MFVFPIRLLAEAVSPLTQPARIWLISLFGKHSKAGSSVEYIPNDVFFRPFVLLWAAIATVYLSAKLLTHILFLRRIKNRLEKAPPQMLEAFADIISTDKNHNMSGKLPRAELFVIGGGLPLPPIAYGFFRKKIALRKNTVDHYGESDINMMLRHEIAHIKHGDVWKRLLFVLVHAIHWFNPIFFPMAQNMTESIELYCDDEAVSGGANRESRLKYGELLLALMSGGYRLALAEPPLTSKGFAVKRIKNITTPPTKTNKFTTAMFSASLGAFAVLCILAFSLQFAVTVKPVDLGIIDYGEIMPDPQKTSENNSPFEVYSLSEQGELTLEQPLCAGTTGIVPAAFITNTDRIAVTLKTDIKDLRVYLYHPDYPNDPMLQIKLSGADDMDCFIDLPPDKYLLGFICENSDVEQIRVIISD